MKTYMLNFRLPLEVTANFANQTAEQIQASIAQWQTWIGSLAAEGRFVATGQLEPDGAVVSGVKATTTDGPFLEVKELLGGYLILKAIDLAEALVYAKGCPVLAVGGSVEVRPLVDLAAN